MESSQDIKELTLAMSKVQQELTHAIKDKKNPHLKNEYASLESIIDAIRPIASKHGISFNQFPESDEMYYYLITNITHTSGQYFTSKIRLLTAKLDMQALGSAITYAKRYTLSSIFGIATGEGDDDGEATVAKQPTKDQEFKPKNSEGKASPAQVNAITSMLSSINADMEAFYAKYQVSSVSELTMNQASEIIQKLQTKK